MSVGRGVVRLPASHPDAPKYWKYETGGELAAAVLQYLTGRSLTIRDVALMRAYLQQWVNSPVWTACAEPDGPEAFPDGPEVFQQLDALRKSVGQIRNREDLEQAIAIAVDLGMDPL